jgi:hypothetical protein
MLHPCALLSCMKASRRTGNEVEEISNYPMSSRTSLNTGLNFAVEKSPAQLRAIVESLQQPSSSQAIEALYRGLQEPGFPGSEPTLFHIGGVLLFAGQMLQEVDECAAAAIKPRKL